MELPKFMFIESPELTGASFILSTSEPFIIAKVLKFSNLDDFELFKNKTKETYTIIEGYKIAVQFYSTLPASTQIKATDELKTTLNNIASFYFKNRIESKLSFYKRYSI